MYEYYKSHYIIITFLNFNFRLLHEVGVLILLYWLYSAVWVRETSSYYTNINMQPPAERWLCQSRLFRDKKLNYFRYLPRRKTKAFYIEGYKKSY